MIKFRCAIKKGLSKFVRRETRSVLYVRNTNGNNILKNWNSSHKHKFVTKTRDQPEPGSLFPRGLWGGDVKDPENEVIIIITIVRIFTQDNPSVHCTAINGVLDIELN